MGVQRRQETRVPRPRPGPDGHPSGGRPSTDRRVRTRRVFLAPTLPMTQTHGVSIGQTRASPLLTPEVIAPPTLSGGGKPPPTADGTGKPQRTTAPPSGYSRRGDRSPRLCFRTVRAGFLAHGSSVIRPLSWAPCRAGDLHVRASPWRVIPPSRHGGRTASAARLVPITSLAPAPRQPLHGLSPRRWLLGQSHHRGVSGGHLRTDAASCILGSSAMPAA